MALDKSTYNQLRKKAESRIKKNQDLLKGITLEKAKTLLHELEVHQIELEMQNEELREAQHRLEESRDQYTDLFDFAPLGYLVVDKKGVIVNINLTACDLLGLKRAIIKGKPLSAYMASGESRTLFLKLQEAFKTGELPSFELQMKHKNKALFTATLQGVVTTNKDSSNPLCRIALQDITALKETEALVLEHEALKKEKDKIQQYIDLAPVVFLLLDAENRVVTINKKGCELSGFSAEEIIGKHWFEGFICDIGNNCFEKEERAFHKELTAYPENFQCKLRSKSNGNIIMSWSNSILRDNKGRFLGTIMAGEDITEQKKIELRKQEYTQNLEAIVEQRTKKLTEALRNEKMVNEMKTAFVSMASHEFRTPLTSVMSSAILMEKYNNLKQFDKQSRHIERIKSSVKQLTNILEDFLSIDKLDRGIVTTCKEAFDLKLFVGEVLEEVRWTLKEQQKIHFQYKGSSKVVMDKKILHNIFINLISNAIKYSVTDILINIKVENDMVHVDFIDQGIGIPKDEQKLLFTKFFRAKNVVNIQGTGLGLNIVKHYVDLLEGDITFESELEKGTTFHLSLPINT
jgi:PAS domain S-box-containing protein